MKKIFALLLTVCMVIGLFPTAVFAADGEHVTPSANGNWIDLADTSWYSADGTEFTIDSAAKLAGLAAIVNGTATGITQDSFANKKVTLGADIDLSGKEWTPIGDLGCSKQFAGTFDGNNKTISGLTINQGYGSTKARAGLFAGVQGINNATDTTSATIKDLTFKNANITISGSNARAGVLAGNLWSGTYVTNVDVDGATITTTGSTGGTIIAGGLCAYSYTSMFENCDVKNVTLKHSGAGTAYIGGMSGMTAGYDTYWTTEPTNTMYKNCTVESVTIDCNAADSVIAGGFINGSSYNSSNNSQVNCTVTGLNATLSGDAEYQVGGFAGFQYGMGYDTSCSATGTINSTGTNANSAFGGFFGCRNGRGRDTFYKVPDYTDGHSNHTANVNITVSNGNVGGFVGKLGQHSTNTYVFTNCTVSGNVSTANGRAGGFMAYADGNDGATCFKITLDNCKCTGSVAGSTYAAGLWGQIVPFGTTENIHLKKNCTPTEISKITGASVSPVANVTKEYFLDNTAEGDEYAFTRAAAWTHNESGYDLGYATIAETLTKNPNSDNITLLADTEADFTVNKTSTFTLNLDNTETSENNNGTHTVNKYTLKGTVTVPAGTNITIKGSKTDNAIVLKAEQVEGKVFAGWYTASNFSGEKLANDTVTAPTADGTTYYPRWVDSKITFNANGGTGTMADQYDNVGTALSDNAFTREHYTFKNWNTKADGTGTSYADKANIAVAGEYTLYAQWTPDNYSITYELNGGTAGANAPATHTYDKATTLVSPTKTGYTFDGWYTTDNFAEGTKVTVLAANSYTENITLYAKWTVNKYTITFNTAGGSEVEDITEDYGATITPPTNPTKTGYTFASWDKTIPETMPAENMTLTATWTANTYTIKFDANNGSGNMDSLQATYDEHITLTKNTYTNGDKYFIGWARTADASVEEFTDETSVMNLAPSGEVTLYAVWNTLPPFEPETNMTAQEYTYSGQPHGFSMNPEDTDYYSVAFKLNGNDFDGLPQNVGVYDVIITRETDGTHCAYHNEIIGGLVIKPATLTATYAGETVKFGDAPALTVKVEGFVNGETADTADGYTAPTVDNSNTAIGRYELTPAGGEATNYIFNYVSGTLTIEDYEVIQGENQQVIIGSDAVFTSNADFSKFAGVKVDGELISEEYYTAESGSTKITLKASYVETLSAGEHTLTIVSTDGEATTGFTVANKSAPKPETKPEPCDHSFDANGKCKYCGIIVIDHTTEKADDESNPNTGAESAIGVAAAIAAISLAGIAVSKKII